MMKGSSLESRSGSVAAADAAAGPLELLEPFVSESQPYFLCQESKTFDSLASMCCALGIDLATG